MADKLSATQVKQTKPREKDYKLFDGKGLFLLVKTNGAKYWRLKYRFHDKEKTLALGVYPEVSLKDAREKRGDARALLAQEIDPGLMRRVNKSMRRERASNSFETIAREWFAKYSVKLKATHADKMRKRLEEDVFPYIGGTPIADVTAPELLSVLRRIEKRGAIETAHRIRRYCSKVFIYGIATGLAETDPAAGLLHALQPYEQNHFSTLTDPTEIGQLLRAIDGYEGDLKTRCALRLGILTFVRPGELRAAEWLEFNLEKAEWRIPESRMKMDAPHTVPLSSQAIAILLELQPLTGHGKYLFPSVMTATRCMSNNTVNAALRRMDYTKEQITGHGFRAMASTLLNEQGFNRDWIERQLAHGERNKVRAAYNHAEYMPERRKMMQAWADYLDGLRRRADVVPIYGAS
jgi:integrase